MAAMEREHELITKVKNISVIEIGDYEMDTWYFSPYPEEFTNRHKLYICQFCLKYMKKAKSLDRHKARVVWRGFLTSDALYVAGHMWNDMPTRR